MPFETSYAHARAHLAELCDRAVLDREVIIVKLSGGKDVAILAADELTSLLETAHLYASPTNAHRLLHAFEELEAGKGIVMTVEELRKTVGLDH